MSPTIDDAALDATLAKIATCTHATVCSASPANYAGIAAVALAASTLTAGDGNGDWTIANGDTSGRKLTMAAQTGLTGSASGAGNYVAFDDGTTRLAVIDGDGDTVNNGSPVTISAVDVVELRDPVNE